MRKRLFAALLALCLALGMLPGLTTPAFASGKDNSAESQPWQDGEFNDGVYEGYYAQLDALQKMLYDKIKEAFSEPVRESNIVFDEPILIGAEDGEEFTGNDLYQWMCDNVYHDRGGRYAVFRDHPELPWLLAVDYGARALGEYLYDDQGICTGFRMTGMFYENTYPWVPPEAYTDPSALQEAADAAIVELGEARPSRAATVRAIHDYLCELVIAGDRKETVPDKDGGDSHTVYYDQTSYSAMVSPHTSVCNGYSAAFKLLCDRYGIPCVHLSGKCFYLNGNEGNHAWNYVQLEDGKWYAVDPTWGDDQPISYDHFLVGKNTRNSAGVTFADMHETPPYNNYLPACPSLSDTAYPYLEAELDDVPDTVEMGGSVQLQLDQIRDLRGKTVTGVTAGLFEGSSQTPVATGRIHDGSIRFNYDTSESKLGEGSHPFFVKSTSGEQKGAILAAVDISLKSSGSAAKPEAATATPTASTVLVNGEKNVFDAYNIGGNNFFKLRDLAYVLSGTDKQFEVGWDADLNAISLTSGTAYTAVGGEMTGKGSGTQAAAPSASKIILDGNEVSLTSYNIGGNNFFKLRDIGKAFDFGIGWDSEAQTITIDTSAGYIE